MAPAHHAAHDNRCVIGEQTLLYSEALQIACRTSFPQADIQVFNHGGKTLKYLQANPAFLLLLGLNFLDTDSVELLAQITRQRLAEKVILVSEPTHEHRLFSLRNARFDGALDATTESLENIKRALRLIGAGQSYISPTLRPYLIEQLPKALTTEELTATELRVLRVIGEGCDNEEASALLGIQPSTVQTHRRNIMRKLKVSTSAKLVGKAIRLGVVRIATVSPMERPKLDMMPHSNGA